MNAKRIQRAFLQPFSESDLEWRVQSSGAFNGKVWCRVLAYVTNRAIQTRLDNVVGVFGWKNEFSSLPNSVGEGSLCGISVKSDDEWVTKYDGSDNTQIEATKGGLSGSMKRAAVQFGIGRYLYDVEASYAICISTEEFKKLNRDQKHKYEKGKLKDGQVFYWAAPELEARFLPKKMVTIPNVKTIKELAEETKTELKDICENFGVDEIKDLYFDEAGAAMTMLLKKKELQKDENGTD